MKLIMKFCTLRCYPFFRFHENYIYDVSNIQNKLLRSMSSHQKTICIVVKNFISATKQLITAERVFVNVRFCDVINKLRKVI